MHFIRVANTPIVESTRATRSATPKSSIVISSPEMSPITLESSSLERVARNDNRNRRLSLSTQIDTTQLVPWTTVLKETHGVGTLSSMTRAQKDRIDESVIEFLSQILDPQVAQQCRVLQGKKNVSALPPYLTEQFQDWLGVSFFL